MRTSTCRLLASLLGSLVLPLIIGGASSVHARGAVSITAVLAAPGAAPPCLPPANPTYTPIASGATGVLFRGSGFQPGERVALGEIQRTPSPPTTSIVARDVLPIVDVIADASGNFACFASLDIPFRGTSYYEQIGAFSPSTAGLSGTERLPVALLAMPALPPTGTGAIADTPRLRTELPFFVAAFAVIGLVAGCRRLTRPSETQ